MPTTVIVGASVAGIRTAQALRSKGYLGRIIVVEAEDEWPYDKPPLSKGFLKGENVNATLELISKDEAKNSRIEIWFDQRAVRLRPAERVLELSGSEPLTYDSLVIATGSRARPSPWGHPSGLHMLRTMDDARALRLDLKPNSRLAIIGAGFIGAEVASTARNIGVDVTLIDPMPYPMSRVMPREVGEWFTNLHISHGVKTVFGRGVEEIIRSQGQFRLALTEGSDINVDSVLVGIGSQPNDDWLSDSGLHIDNGVICDQFSRAVNVTNVYAAGDVARWDHPERANSVRVEHWTNAVEQAQVVAHNIINQDVVPNNSNQIAALKPHTPVEYVWSDQYDWKIQVLGTPTQHSDCVIVGDPFKSPGRAIAIFSTNGDLTGAAVINWPRALLAARRALTTSASVQELTTALPEP